MSVSTKNTSQTSLIKSPSLGDSNDAVSPSLPTSPDTFITFATYKKPTTKHVTQLSTSSAAGIAIANQVTPERLSSLLSVTGPLAIRHITSNLSKQIHGFEKLSLSKQRRLIMSCLNRGDEKSSIIFEKIGWGQWSCKKVDPKDFIRERNLIRIANDKVKDSEHNQHQLPADNNSSINDKLRRESITMNKYEADDHGKFLKTKTSNTNNKLNSNEIGISNPSHEFAILSDDDDDNESSDFDDADDGLFKFEDEDAIPPLKLSNQTRISPPAGSTTSSRRQSYSKVSKIPLKNKRSNSQTPTSPELLYYGHKNGVIPTTTRSRRHSSIRSTLNEAHQGSPMSSTSYNTNNNLYTTSSNPMVISSSVSNSISPQILPLPHHLNSGQEQSSSMEEDTDEEDWESIGALKLLKSKVFHHSLDNVVNSTQISEPHPPELKRDEQDAAFALVNLRSV